MRCVVTAGPTYEPLDQVRRLTNFSTGRLGSELANHLAARGHEVILLVSQAAAWHGPRQVARVETFTTTADLAGKLRALAGEAVAAVYHAAAVSDFAFGKIWRRSPGGEMVEFHSGKIPTREGSLVAELVPTPKIIPELRGWFPKARLVGWKYEVEGDRDQVVRLARDQIAACRTDACVANGAAYGVGFGLVTAATIEHLDNSAMLFEALANLLAK